jgi:hypothetical protein
MADVHFVPSAFAPQSTIETSSAANGKPAESNATNDTTNLKDILTPFSDNIFQPFITKHIIYVKECGHSCV